MGVNKVSEEIVAEAYRAATMYPPFNSAHEGLCVIWEEFDELKLEVFRKKQDRDRMREEAIELGAMALRFVMDVCDANRQ